MSIASTCDAANHPDPRQNCCRKMRLAVIGCGPRGLQCLEALSRINGDARQAIDITVFEPAEVPGAGRVYDPGQPHTLRMNFATQHIDFWRTPSQPLTDRAGSLLGWLSERYPSMASADQYIPRAIVGEYLSDCFEQVSKNFASSSLQVVRQRVQRIRRDQHRWKVDSDECAYEFDLVVIATGHEGLRPSPSFGASQNLMSVFPVEAELSTARIPSGAKVFVRGMGLTAIDAVLSLTEGRGGEFQNRNPLPHYINSPDEPFQIDLRSRSGRPMLAKPTAKVEPVRDDFWEPFRSRLRALAKQHGQIVFQKSVFPMVCKAAAELLNHACGDGVRERDVSDWYRGWSRYRMDSSSACDAMFQSYAVATGKHPKDIPFALGEAWRRLYPELVSLISYGGLASDQYGSFRRVAGEMERIAFGPPATNIGKLLTLIRGNLVTVGSLDDVSERHSNYDASVNAVIAAPQDHRPDGPIADLLADHVLKQHEPTGAVMTDRDGFIPDTQRTLAMFGRATEGWIVGNDTLSRTLHDQIERWATHVGVVAESAAERAKIS